MSRVEQSRSIDLYSSNNPASKVKNETANIEVFGFDAGEVGDGFVRRTASESNPITKYSKIINKLKQKDFGLGEYLNMEDEPFKSAEDMLITIAPNFGFTGEEMKELLKTVTGDDIKRYLERMLQDPEMSAIYNEMLNDYVNVSDALSAKEQELIDKSQELKADYPYTVDESGEEVPLTNAQKADIAKRQKEIDKLQQEVDDLKMSKRYVHTEILGDILTGINNERKAGK